ncbi:MAG: hypothetical protein AAF614_10215 [Chloroflexota bacterium]
MCLLLFVFIAACQATPLENPLTAEGLLTATDEEEQPPALATAYAAATALAATVEAPTVGVGNGRLNPLPADTELITQNSWEIVVLETQRGEAAWEMIRLANGNNEPAADGREYLLVKYWIKNNSTDPDKASLGLHLTGNGLVIHYSFDAGVVEPDPQLETYLAGETESIGWVAYQVYENEGNLMLLVDDLFTYDAGPLYVALDPGAKIEVPDALRSITPTEIGQVQRDPAPYGQLVTTADWQVRVSEVVVGETAWEQIYAANSFNEPPADKVQYVLVKVWLRYIGTEEGPHYVNDDEFGLVGYEAIDEERPSLVDPDPELTFEVYPGGEVEGWFIRQAPADTTDLVLHFSPSQVEGDGRYLSLAVSGR